MEMLSDGGRVRFNHLEKCFGHIDRSELESQPRLKCECSLSMSAGS